MHVVCHMHAEPTEARSRYERASGTGVTDKDHHHFLVD